MKIAVVDSVALRPDPEHVDRFVVERVEELQKRGVRKLQERLCALVVFDEVFAIIAEMVPRVPHQHVPDEVADRGEGYERQHQLREVGVLAVVARIEVIEEVLQLPSLFQDARAKAFHGRAASKLGQSVPQPKQPLHLPMEQLLEIPLVDDLRQ